MTDSTVASGQQLISMLFEHQIMEISFFYCPVGLFCSPHWLVIPADSGWRLARYRLWEHRHAPLNSSNTIQYKYRLNRGILMQGIHGFFGHVILMTLTVPVCDLNKSTHWFGELYISKPGPVAIGPVQWITSKYPLTAPLALSTYVPNLLDLINFPSIHQSSTLPCSPLDGRKVPKIDKHIITVF